LCATFSNKHNKESNDGIEIETAKNRKDASTSSTPTPNKKYNKLKNQELNTVYKR